MIRVRYRSAISSGAGGVGSIPANSNVQNVPSFRRWLFEMKFSPPFSAMLGYKDIEVFSLISKIFSISGKICLTWGRWAPHWPCSSHADGSHLLVLDPLGRSVLLRASLDALSCWSSAQKAVPKLCLLLMQWPGPGMDRDCRRVTVDSPDFK